MSRPKPWGVCLAFALALLLAACAEPVTRADSDAAAATLVWPKAPEPARIRYLRAVSGPQDWGISRSLWQRVLDGFSGRGPERFMRPSAVAERAGVLYVADPGAPALWLLDAPHDRYAKVTRIGQQALLSPVALALGPDSTVFVADTGLKQVFWLDAQGGLIRSFATQAMQRPAALAWDAATQQLLVLDSLRHRVLVFDRNAQLLRRWGDNGHKDGQFNHPTHMVLTDSGILLITDALNFRVQAIGRDGSFLWKFGQNGNGAGDFAAPKGIASDSAGHVYVVDALFDAVQIFNPQGQLLLGFGQRGSQAGQFALPRGIFISSEDKVYLADTYNQRIQVFLGAVATTQKEAVK